MPGFVDFLHSVIGTKDTGQHPLTVSGPTRGGNGGTDYRGTTHEGRKTKPAPKAGPSPHLLHLLDLLTQMQGGVEATRGQRGISSPLQPFPPGNPGYDLTAPDAGDLYDYQYSNGDPGLIGLFGSPDPVPLRQPPPGVSRRRGY